MQSATFKNVQDAVVDGRVYVSEHAYDEAVADRIEILELFGHLSTADVIEDYPQDPRGASCLVLSVGPIHSVWGYDDEAKQGILITVYRPDPSRWSEDFRVRRPKT